MVVSIAANLLPSLLSDLIKITTPSTKEATPEEECRTMTQFCPSNSQSNSSRRTAGLILLLSATWPQALIARAEDEGILSSITSLLDPNEKTKSGKVLPKAYLKSAREVVKTLRDSLKEDSKDNAKFRRNADAAKESIREYLGNWRGQATVSSEESYVELEKAIRALAGFYSKAGPSAALPEDVKAQILNDLTAAEQSL